MVSIPLKVGNEKFYCLEVEGGGGGGDTTSFGPAIFHFVASPPRNY